MDPVILVVQHADDCPAGWLGESLVAAGAILDVRRADRGDDQTLTAEHHGLVVLGGPQDSWDGEAAPWLLITRTLLRDAFVRRVPTLGVCLGHQLAVLALGGTVARNPRGPTLGVRDVVWPDAVAHDSLFSAVAGARRAIHWNSDIALTLPDGAVALTSTSGGVPQSVRLGPAMWSVQFHPEVGPDLIKLWAEDERAALEVLGYDVDAAYDAVVAEAEVLREAWAPLGTRFAEIARR